ncbi:MAG: carbohydrate binding domain-containing protein, partial [Candidatus Ratteibacteria bacterium]
MRKLLIMIFIFQFFVFCEENLVKNWSFEEGDPQYGVSKILPGWAIRDFPDVVHYHSIDSEISRSGKRSAKIKIDTAEKTGYFTPYPKIEVKPHKKYILEFWAKTDVSEGEGNASVGLSLLDKDKKFLGMHTIQTLDLPKKSDWQKYKIEYRTIESKENMLLNITFGLTGIGTVWYDDISIYEVKEEEKMIIDFYPATLSIEKTIYPVKNEISYAIFHFFSDEKFKDFRIQIKTPLLFPLIHSFSNYGINEFKEIKEEKNYKYYEIKLNPEIVKPLKLLPYDLWWATTLIFKTDEKIEKDKLEWKIIGDGEEIKTGTFKIDPVEKMEKIDLPKNFRIYAWHLFPVIHKEMDYEVFKKVIELYDKVGIKGGEIPVDDRKYKFLKEKNWEIIDYFWFQIEGCPVEFLESRKFEEICEDSIKRYLKPDLLMWNYEPTKAFFEHF